MSEGTGEGNSTGGGTGDNQEFAWEAQLPQDLRGNPEIKGKFKTIGDFAKTHLDLIPRLKEAETLKAQLAAAPTRPGEAKEYEFEGENLDPKITDWARNAFFEAGLSKDQAKKVGASWNGLIAQMATAETQQRETEFKEAETKLKAELGDKYDASIEMVKRVWKDLSNSEFDAFVNETKIGNDPRLIRFMINVAKKTGEDLSPTGSPGGGKPAAGLVYDKSPELYKR